jgi:hypothetical protein
LRRGGGDPANHHTSYRYQCDPGNASGHKKISSIARKHPPFQLSSFVVQ